LGGAVSPDNCSVHRNCFAAVMTLSMKGTRLIRLDDVENGTVGNMVKMIFVHGTGVRDAEYAESLKIIEERINASKQIFNISDLTLVPCYWAGNCGTNLKADGASIPYYISTRGGEEDEVNLWEKLYEDPLYEIRILSLKPEGIVTYDELETFCSRVENFTPDSELVALLEKNKLDRVFEQAHQEIINSQPYKWLIDKISGSFKEYYAVIARAFIASAFFCCKRSGIYTHVRHNESRRDAIINAIISSLTQNEQEQGYITNFGKMLLQNKFVDKRRGYLTDKFYPKIGDILYYQAKGQKIRDDIRKQISSYESPVIILAHSLGGIACVDMLIESKLPQVELLITVGSQAPFLYEIDALQSLSYKEPLPEYFPEWLNLYDRRDILSYIGEELFPDKITDRHIDNNLPFPESHGAYWQTEETWNVIFELLKSKNW
jgi:hypothetical protein